MEQYMPTMIMFAITTVFTLLLLLPTRFKFGTDLMRFYWKGFWVILAMIAIVAGGAETLNLAGYDVEQITLAVLTGLIAVLPVFVVFGWFRIVGVILFENFQRRRQVA